MENLKGNIALLKEQNEGLFDSLQRTQKERDALRMKLIGERQKTARMEDRYREEADGLRAELERTAGLLAVKRRQLDEARGSLFLVGLGVIIMLLLAALVR